MSSKHNRFTKHKLNAFLLAGIAAVLMLFNTFFTNVSAQQDAHQRLSQQKSPSLSLTPDVEVKERYYLGEDITIKFRLTNTTGFDREVKDIGTQAFDIRVEGEFPEEGLSVDETDYDASVTKSERTLKEGEHSSLTKRIPKNLIIKNGQSMELDYTLSGTLTQRVGINKYRMTVRFEDGQTVVRNLEVYYDDEKSGAVFAEKLRSGSDGDQNWAFYHLSKLNPVKLITLLEELQQSDDEKLRGRAKTMLSEARKPN